MEFKSQKAIYLQIADLLCDGILSGVYPEDERLPSVRDFASQVEVNVNTVARSFDYLQQKGVAVSRRGLGLFVATGAREAIYSIRREEFFAESLPDLFSRMDTLHISLDEVAQAYNAGRTSLASQNSSPEMPEVK